MKLGYAIGAIALMLAAIATDAMAGTPVAAPEISPVSIAGGLGLLAGGVLLLRARFGK